MYYLIFLILVFSPGFIGLEWFILSVFQTESEIILDVVAELAPFAVSSFSEVGPCDLSVSPVKGDAGKSRSP